MKCMKFALSLWSQLKKNNMTTRKAIAAASMLTIAVYAYADGDISGRVFSKNTSEPIDFVNVTLVSLDTEATSPTGTATDETGAFTLHDVPSGRYIIRFSNIGNVTQEREISVGETAVDLGRIELADDSRLLEEVVVTGEKRQLSVSTERRVFSVSSNIASTGASADELLASIPSVDVNHDGDISLRGKTDVKVWINGKEAGMNADNRIQMLSQIPAESIESIEVLTNPSSKHGSEGTAGIINIKLKENMRDGYSGTAEADADTRGNVNASLNMNYNKGRFETFAALGLKSHHNPGGAESLRTYDDGYSLGSSSDIKKHENSMFLRLGANFKANENNILYLSAIGTLGQKRGHTETSHLNSMPGQWSSNLSNTRESGKTRGANIMAGYKHSFRPDHYIDMNVSYNIWRGQDDSRTREDETWPEGPADTFWLDQHQDVKISNWEAAIDYSNRFSPWLTLDAGYKGNYNHENSPASYQSGQSESDLRPMPELFNRFMYDTNISAFYINLSGGNGSFSYSAGLRGEAWTIRTRSLGYGESMADSPLFKKNDFALFPSASAGWSLPHNNELRLGYTRRIRRPHGPQLNTFENVSDPSEVHLGNPLIQPEYSDSFELSYIKTWNSHMLSVSGYVRSDTDMISHVSFLAPMASDPDMNTMYYGHANVGNMLDSGLEIIARNTLFGRLTLTTSLNVYDSRLKAWSTGYPLHGDLYDISGERQHRIVWDVRCMASVRLPWDMTLQASGRYTSRRIAAQGSIEPAWDVEAGIRKNFGPWSVSLVCKDIFDSRKSHDILTGNGYTQSISKWSGGRTLRLAATYTFGKKGRHSHDKHNHIDTGGYGEEHNH